MKERLLFCSVLIGASALLTSCKDIRDVQSSGIDIGEIDMVHAQGSILRPNGHAHCAPEEDLCIDEYLNEF